MAKIVLSELAPDEAVQYSLGTAEPFELGGSKKTFETDDRELLSNASVHPWLKVEYPVVESVYYETVSTHIPASEDAFSASGPNAAAPFDPEEIAKVEESKVLSGAHLAVEADLDQTKSVVEDGIARTLEAADENLEETKPEPTKTKTKKETS